MDKLFIFVQVSIGSQQPWDMAKLGRLAKRKSGKRHSRNTGHGLPLLLGSSGACGSCSAASDFLALLWRTAAGKGNLKHLNSWLPSASCPPATAAQ